MESHMIHHEGSDWYASDGEEQFSDSYDCPSNGAES